jgi:hypothetical protein
MYGMDRDERAVQFLIPGFFARVRTYGTKRSEFLEGFPRPCKRTESLLN